MDGVLFVYEGRDDRRLQDYSQILLSPHFTYLRIINGPVVVNVLNCVLDQFE